jgi:hypothetical protein
MVEVPLARGGEERMARAARTAARMRSAPTTATPMTAAAVDHRMV